MDIVDPTNVFELVYRSQEPDGSPLARAGWDIGAPQPVLVDLEREGKVRGAVLDIGCGTGDNALHLADRGYAVTGLDRAPSAIAHAEVKAAQHAAAPRFAVADALNLDTYRDEFDTIVDCGLFHTFPDADQVDYLASLLLTARSGARLHVMAISDDAAGDKGPRRLTEAEMRAPFTDGWILEDLRRVTMVGSLVPGAPPRPDNPAWLATARRG